MKECFSLPGLCKCRQGTQHPIKQDSGPKPLSQGLGL